MSGEANGGDAGAKDGASERVDAYSPTATAGRRVK